MNIGIPIQLYTRCSDNTARHSLENSEESQERNIQACDMRKDRQVIQLETLKTVHGEARALIRMQPVNECIPVSKLKHTSTRIE